MKTNPIPFASKFKFLLAGFFLGVILTIVATFRILPPFDPEISETAVPQVWTGFWEPMDQGFSDDMIHNYFLKYQNQTGNLNAFGPWNPIYLDHSFKEVITSLDSVARLMYPVDSERWVGMDSLRLRLYFAAYPEQGVEGHPEYRKQKTIVAVIAKQNYLTPDVFDDPDSLDVYRRFDLGMPCPPDCKGGRRVMDADGRIVEGSGADMAFKAYGDRKGAGCLSDENKCD